MGRAVKLKAQVQFGCAPKILSRRSEINVKKALFMAAVMAFGVSAIPAQAEENGRMAAGTAGATKSILVTHYLLISGTALGVAGVIGGVTAAVANNDNGNSTSTSTSTATH